jgi:hypothetical protein
LTQYGHQEPNREGKAMSKEVYRYSFGKDVPLQDVEESFLLAVLAVECLHGQARVRLDAGYYLDKPKRACVVDASTPVGQDINKIFTGFCIREFGEDSFKVERVDGPPQKEERRVKT